jgi:methylmalonyl-CoA/ethylmalonyl-CoA epimerase
MALLRIAQIALAVSDIDRSEQFYAKVLGLVRLVRQGSFAFFDCARVKLMLERSRKGVVPTAGVCHYFLVDRVEQTVQGLKAKTVQFDDEPQLVVKMLDHDLWMAFFRDPDDHLLALMEVRR